MRWFDSPAGVHYELAKLLAQNPHRQVWRAKSDRFLDKCTIVELVADVPRGVVFRDPDASRPRGVIDLRSCPGATEVWPPVAIVTLLPARLPEPYGRFELIEFIGMGGMGQVWMADCPDHQVPLAVKFITLPESASHYAAIEQFRRNQNGPELTIRTSFTPDN